MQLIEPKDFKIGDIIYYALYNSLLLVIDLEVVSKSKDQAGDPYIEIPCLDLFDLESKPRAENFFLHDEFFWLNCE